VIFSTETIRVILHFPRALILSPKDVDVSAVHSRCNQVSTCYKLSIYKYTAETPADEI
jgi:hypothetical protein